MVIVKENTGIRKPNKEVLLCHSPQLNRWYCMRMILKYWNQDCVNVQFHSEMFFAPKLFYIVQRVYLTVKSNGDLKPQLIVCYDGVTGTKKKESMACTIDQDPEGRRLFPPQEQHKIVALATQPPQEQDCPITHWSIPDLQQAVLRQKIVRDISAATIWRLLDQAAIKPHLWHYWLNSNDPDFETKMLDIVDLYLRAPKMHLNNEIVLSVDEKTSIQALQRKYPSKPILPGQRELTEHEYIRHGTRCLTAGFEVATGAVMGMLTDNRPAEIFADFIKWVCDYYRDVSTLHIVLDNLNTHYHESVCRIIAEQCNIEPGDLSTVKQRKAFLCCPDKSLVFHFTPSHASWLNQIEIWFSTLSRKVINRGNFNSVADLDHKIIAFIKYYNKVLARPYKWTYTGKPLADAA